MEKLMYRLYLQKRWCWGERSTGFSSILRQLPPIAFACIDEAHCVFKFSHNFRPSYMMICKVLKKNLGVKSYGQGHNHGENDISSDTPLSDNVILSVSRDENRDSALLQLLLIKHIFVVDITAVIGWNSELGMGPSGLIALHYSLSKSISHYVSYRNQMSGW
ncbi:ATP-dependent DNA helicase Q4-like isoform X2 [Musca autumnalis]|uniref:ATP-dependent DNA helicase Q4-like isoform X2 n=1 Tax=Musca autumnalis TaxID=221902 RepID=UPI003CEF2024